MSPAPLLLASLLPAAPPAPEAHQAPAAALLACLADARTLTPKVARHARYVSAYNAPAADLKPWEQTLAFSLNSWSRHVLPVPPVPVPGGAGRLWRVDLSAYHIDPEAWDRLAREGSGRAPLPDPYFRLEQVRVVEKPRYEYRDAGYWSNTYGGRVWVPGPRTREQVGVTRVRKRAAVYPPWLPAKELAELEALTHSESPVLRADWLCYYGWLEPAYHRLLGLDDTKESFLKLAAADERLADREGVQVRGAVLFSEVAGNNRALQRTPSILRYGAGYYWESIDFDRSDNRDDVLRDLLSKPRAQELIASTRNGLQVYMVVDANGKRLDRAGIEFAHDTRNPFRSVEVEIRNCVCCHARGLLEIADDVRDGAGDNLALALRALKKKDPEKAQKITERYLAVDIGALVAGDQRSYDAAVRATNGLTAAANALQVQRLLVGYERGLRLEDLAAETGFPPALVLGVIERSAPAVLDHSVVRLAQKRLPGRKVAQGRRDQYEALGHAQLMTLLSRVPVETPPPAAKGPREVAKGKKEE